MDSPALIRVQFACNDDHGDPAGVVRAVDWRSNGIANNYPPLHLGIHLPTLNKLLAADVDHVISTE